MCFCALYKNIVAKKSDSPNQPFPYLLAISVVGYRRSMMGTLISPLVAYNAFVFGTFGAVNLSLPGITTYLGVQAGRRGDVFWFFFVVRWFGQKLGTVSRSKPLFQCVRPNPYPRSLLDLIIVVIACSGVEVRV